MLRVVLAGFLLSLSHGVFAFEFPIEMIEGVDGARVVLHVDKSDIEEGTRWTPFEGAPPVSVDDALVAVRAHLEKNTLLQDVTLREVQLRPVPHHENNWHYMVIIQAMTDGKPVLHYYAVLMSGKLIPAIREPESYK